MRFTDFLNILFKILDEEEPSHLLVAFDEKHRLSAIKCTKNTKGKENRCRQN